MPETAQKDKKTMLKLQDIVFAKGPKGETLKQDYERIYFSHTNGDAVKTVEKTFDGKTAGTAQVPDGDSKASVEQLYNEMVDYFMTEFKGSDPEKPVNPQVIQMSLSEKGLDLTKRANVGASLRPKEVDIDKTIERQAKGLVALGIAPSYDAAVKMVKDAIAASKPAAQTA
jgi:hypothetical protein